MYIKTKLSTLYVIKYIYVLIKTSINDRVGQNDRKMSINKATSTFYNTKLLATYTLV